eukprot:CAMPEP_0115092498 /NCGR_PEP_ID=MMETSP0227-20121206/26804_1 /TAXON_ID=89957 /ORGANISM="Polarella glacialis, Strain CCMP 1383" /LENGTH=50 /DNA_ID=CAMNT_0002484333 /DNA_START=195 /DNA_END=347 /DNA_ORIENTATION=+
MSSVSPFGQPGGTASCSSGLFPDPMRLMTSAPSSSSNGTCLQMISKRHMA